MVSPFAPLDINLRCGRIPGTVGNHATVWTPGFHQHPKDAHVQDAEYVQHESKIFLGRQEIKQRRADAVRRFLVDLANSKNVVRRKQLAMEAHFLDCTAPQRDVLILLFKVQEERMRKSAVMQVETIAPYEVSLTDDPVSPEPNPSPDSSSTRRVTWKEERIAEVVEYPILTPEVSPIWTAEERVEWGLDSEVEPLELPPPRNMVSSTVALSGMFGRLNTQTMIPTPQDRQRRDTPTSTSCTITEARTPTLENREWRDTGSSIASAVTGAQTLISEYRQQRAALFSTASPVTDTQTPTAADRQRQDSVSSIASILTVVRFDKPLPAIPRVPAP